MKTTNIRGLKDHLSKFLDDVKRGEEVLIRDRNRPVAKIVPLRNLDDYSTEELELVSEGVMRLPEKNERLPQSFFTERRPTVSADLIKKLRKDRDAD